MEVMEITNIKDYLESLCNYENVAKLLSIVRQINCYNGRFDDLDYWENDEEFFDVFFQGKPIEVARAVYYGDYNFTDDYVHFDVYGNLQSANAFSLAIELKCYIDDIAEEIANLKENDNYNVLKV